MEDFRGKLAVITGAGSGMGRELALQLVRAGAHVAICDLFEDTLREAEQTCRAAAAGGVRVSAHTCDVSDEKQVIAFRDAVLHTHSTDHIHLLFNNAGIGGGGSFIRDSREQWERTFNVCWHGVYFCTRAFLPLLIASSGGCIINTSSVNGFFALLPTGPHTAYSTAKFAVKGFSEALLTDLRVNAPHVRVALVMPGHVGTSIYHNSLRDQGAAPPETMTTQELARARQDLQARNMLPADLDDAKLRLFIRQRIDAFRDNAPLSAAKAATLILDGVREGRWRILIGEDAKALDKIARDNPDQLYEPDYIIQAFAALQPKR
jgi:NAD(P)-dependent dehydrogenase (short-subunit alcohol dehydrogenase family)